jgi:hypothetical protein
MRWIVSATPLPPYPPPIGAVVVPCNSPRLRLYSYQMAVLPYYIRYRLITAYHPAGVSYYVHRAVTVNITALLDMTPCSLVESYFSFSYMIPLRVCNSAGPRNPADCSTDTPPGACDDEVEMCMCVFISFVRIESPHPPGRPVNNHGDQGRDK